MTTQSNTDRELTNMDYVEISGIRYKPTRKTVVTGWELPIGAGTPDLIYETAIVLEEIPKDAYEEQS